jgi:hypothetical protein
MQTVTTIGFDIAKSVFQVHGVDAAGQVVFANSRWPTHSPMSSQRKPKSHARWQPIKKCYWPSWVAAVRTNGSLTPRRLARP